MAEPGRDVRGDVKGDVSDDGSGGLSADLVARQAQAAQRSRPSLSGQLLVRLLPVLIGLFAISGALSYFGARHYANLVYDRWLQDSAEALALRITAVGGKPVLDLPEAAREMLQWDATDTTWYEIIGDRHGHLAGQLGLPRRSGGLGEPGSSQRYDGRIGENLVRVASMTLTPKESDESVHVVGAETLRKRQALATELMLSILLAEVLLLLTAIAIVAWTLRRMLQPVRRVAEALEAQTHHSLEPLDDRDLPREVAPLTLAMNNLLLRLKGALLAQRHFIADAAHQLRTPLTALKLHTDEAARETDPQRLRPLIGELQKAADRAVRLSNQLLALARAEPSAATTADRPFDLRQVVIETTEHWFPVALADGVDLGFDEVDGPPIPIVGDPMLIAEALNNLLDNALKYGRPNGRVTVAVGLEGQQVWLTVLDDGPGIPLAARGRMLERFQRLEPDRATGTASSGTARPTCDAPTGSGLGLAIVAEIARRHGGEVTLTGPASGSGLLATMILPRRHNSPV